MHPSRPNDRLARPLAALLSAMMIASAHAATIDWTAFQLSDNTVDDIKPTMAPGRVVWQGRDVFLTFASDYEIRLYEQGQVSKLSNTGYWDLAPDAWGQDVVWYGTGEVFLHDGVGVQQISTGSTGNTDPQVHDGQATWFGSDGDSEIYFWDGSTTTQLTSNVFDDRAAQIHSGRVAWQQKTDHADNEVFYFDGSATIRVTDNGVEDRSPQVWGQRVAWIVGDGQNDEVMLYDGLTDTVTALSSDGWPKAGLEIWGDRVAWYGFDGSDWEIFVHDGAAPQQVTNNSYDDFEPVLWQDRLAWWGYAEGADGEIFYHDGSTTYRLTDNDANDLAPAIWGADVSWYSWDGPDPFTGDWEVFVARARGDTNNDGVVDSADFNALASNFSSTAGVIWEHGDFNADGVVDSADFNVLASNFGYGSAPAPAPAPASPIPAPASAVALALALPLLHRR